MRNETIRALVQTLQDAQDMRIRTANRLSLKKDDSHQDKEDAILSKNEIEAIETIKDYTKLMERKILSTLEHELKSVPIYTEFLKNVKGCGVAMSACIVANIDIEKATTVSKIYQYAGMNSGLVRGKKKSKDKDGNIIIEETDEMIRGDKLTKGFNAPYNAKFKAKMLGVLADCFIKSKSEYTKFYYDYKNRLENSEQGVGGDPNRLWKNESAGHRDRAAKRYMVKMFMYDLYKNWRTLEGLEVRVPYQEEYLGHVHQG